MIIVVIFAAANANSAEIVKEAESAKLSGSFVVVEDAKYSGGKYITPKSTEGSAVIEFEVNKDGEYEIWIKARGLGGKNDSFFFSVNDGSQYIVELRNVNLPVWQKATDRNCKPGVVQLKKGKNKLTISPRETKGLLDVVVIADKGYKPEK